MTFSTPVTVGLNKQLNIIMSWREDDSLLKHKSCKIKLLGTLT